MNGSVVELGRWLAGVATGTVRLTWSRGELLLGSRDGELVSLLGLPAHCVARQLGVEPTGEQDLVVEARNLAAHARIREGQTRDTLITCLQAGLRDWLIDPERTFELVAAEPPARAPGTVVDSGVYIPHAVVDLVLTDEQDILAATVLPDPHVTLRRTDQFDSIYSRLQPSEEADLIVAKITGQRTADEIASRSPHGVTEVLRLLAGLVAGGLAETVSQRDRSEPAGKPTETDPKPAAVGNLAIEAPIAEELEPQTRTVPWRWILAAIGILLAVLISLVWALHRPAHTAASDATAVEPAESQQRWTIVVDMGCDSKDLARIVKKGNRFPQDLRAVQTDGAEEDETCWRLVWSEFATQADAVAALDQVPDAYLPDGFEPHVVLSRPSGEGDTSP